MNDTTEKDAPQEQARNLPAVQEGRPGRVPIMSGAIPKAIVPIDFDGAYRIANVVVLAGMAPRSLDTVEKVMVAIMHGMEVGLTPMNALQAIAVINGRPSIYGDGAIGLVRASGLCEWIEESYIGTENTDGYTAICLTKRKGDPKPVKGEFSIGDAKTAGLWTKRGRSGEPTPWQTYPKRMLKFRARWALRDAYADVLKGLHLREEMEDLARMQMIEASDHQPQQQRRLAPSPPTDEVKTEETTTTEIAETTTERRAPAPPEEEVKVSDEIWLLSLDNAFDSCEDYGSLGEAQGKHMTPVKGKVSDAAWKEAEIKVRAAFNRIQSNE